MSPSIPVSTRYLAPPVGELGRSVIHVICPLIHAEEPWVEAHGFSLKLGDINLENPQWLFFNPLEHLA